MTGKQTDLQIRRQRLLLPTYFLMDFVVMVEGGGGGGGGGEAPTEIKDLWPAIHQLFKNVLWLAGAIGTRATTRTKLFLVT